MTPATRRALAVIGWAALMWTALFWRLGDPTFWDPDEAHYAVTTREILRSGQWLVPTYNGAPFFDKPILFHLLQAQTMLMAGINESGARLATAGAALGLILTTGWAGAKLADRRTGFIAAVLLTTSPALVALARYAILDAVFTFFLFGAVSVLAVSALRGRPRLQWLGFFLLALATLTKGPIALLLTALTFIVALAVSRDVRARLLRLHWIAGAVVTVLISAPWFAYMYVKFGDAFVQGYVLNENLRLFSTTMYEHQPGWTFYLQIILVGMLPWTFVIVGRLYDVIRGRLARRPVTAFELLLWCWTAVIVVFFSASHFKLDHYVFPAAPALYLLIAGACTDAQEAGANNAGARFGLRMVGPTLGIAAMVLAFALPSLSLPSAVWIVPVSWVALAAVITLQQRRRPLLTASLTAAAFGVLYAVAVMFVVPAIEEHKVMADVARWAAADGRSLCAYRLNRWTNSLIFYADRPVAVADTREELERHRAEGRAGLCVMRGEAFDELRREGFRGRTIYRRDGMWATSGRALRRRRPSLTPFLVVQPEDTTGSTPRSRETHGPIDAR